MVLLHRCGTKLGHPLREKSPKLERETGCDAPSTNPRVDFVYRIATT
jgi:hypothetical protein